jgi:poly(hydroxyalkanoate) depolymerase family esterase
MRNIIFFTMIWAIANTQSFAQSESLQVDGKKRDFIVYAPSSGLPANPPLVLALHPLGATNTQFRSMSKWDAIADKEKIIVVYPQGTAPVAMGGMNMIGWDITSDADVKFMSALIDAMAARYKIDRNRVYSTGFSMGGMLSYVLACRMSDKIAAIGPDAGYPVGQNAGSCTPSAPVPVIHVHGANDSFVTYSGVAPWIKKFADVNKCQQSPTTTNPSSKAKKEDWGPCENGNEVIFYTIAGMGHDYATSDKYDFSATDAFWTFFKAHPRGNVVETKK